jgi:hypothetical protein
MPFLETKEGEDCGVFAHHATQRFTPVYEEVTEDVYQYQLEEGQGRS